MGSAPGQAHWPPPQGGATSGRWPTVPGVTHLIACAQVGPIRTPGGPPNPRGRVPHQRLLRALVTPAPPRSLRCWSLPPSFRPQGRPPVPRPLPCFLAPAMSRLPLLSAPAPACWCPLLFVFFLPLVFSPWRFGLSSAPPHVPSLSPRCPRPFLGWVEEKGAGGGGGGVLAVRPIVHVASTAQAQGAALVPPLGGGGCLVAPVVTLPFLRSHPRWSPHLGLHGACSPWVRSCGSSHTFVPLPPHPAAVFSGGGGGGVRIPLPSSPLSPLSSSLCSTHVAGMTQARRKHRARLQRRGEGKGFPFGAPTSPRSGSSQASPAGPCHPDLPPFAAVLVPVFSLSPSGALVCFVRGCFFFPFFPSPVPSPGTSVCPLFSPHVPSPPPRCPRPFPCWVGELGVGGGGRPRCPSSGVSTSQAQRWHVARHLSLCWGAGHAAWPPSSPFPLCVRSPGAPPAGACTARASFGHGRVVRPAPSPRCLPILPLCPREGGPLSAPPFLHPPSLGGRGGVGGGALSSSLRCTHVTGTTQARRWHEARHPSLCRGGGACLAAPVVALSTLRSHPRWSPRRGMHGACPLRARSCGPSCTLLPLPPYPAALSSGGGALFAPPLPAFPALGGAGVGGGGEERRCRLPFVARTSQA